MKRWRAMSCLKISDVSAVRRIPTSSRRTQMWMFGYDYHGGIVRITNLTRPRPNLCKLVKAFLQQEPPDLTYASFQIAVDATLAPHRDVTAHSPLPRYALP